MLDTSAFIAGFDPLSVTDDVYSVPSVERELASNSVPWTRFRAATENGKLKLKTPNNLFLERIKKSAKTVGDVLFLSDVDLEVLALALELKNLGHSPLIVTDDYSIQNVAAELGVEFMSVGTFGIKRLLEWIRYCPACHSHYPANFPAQECQICGTRLKRKPSKTLKNLRK